MSQLPPPSGPSPYPPPPPPPPPSQPSPMDAYSQMPSQGTPQGPIASRGTLVDVKVSCRNISTPAGSHVQPSSFVVIFSYTPGKSDWNEVMRSETIPNSSDPQYRRIFQMEYKFELYQQLRIVAFHRNSNSENLQVHTLIGVADCTLGQIIASQSTDLQLPLINADAASNAFPDEHPFQSNNFGTVCLVADEIKSAKNIISFQFSISNVITEEQSNEQQEYLNSLRSKMTNMPSAKKGLPKRGAAALLGKFRNRTEKREDNTNQNVNAVPAHMANQNKQQENEINQVQNEIKEVELEIINRPPPFIPYVTILRAPKSASSAVDIRGNDIKWEEIYKSIEIQNYQEIETGTSLQPLTLSEYDICEGDPNRMIKLAVIQKSHDRDKRDAYVGEWQTTFPALQQTCQNQKEIALQLNPLGILKISNYEEKVEKSFIDYLKGGWCDFGLLTAIDFTSSNGDPRYANSKHYLSPPGSGKPNEYEAAMRTVANMLASYSSDSKIPAYGFGAIISDNKPVSHCFPVKETHATSHFCEGVEGLINAYKATLGRIRLHGPTMFSEILKTTHSIVSRRHQLAIKAGNNKLAYTVLLILTDGAISDHDATLQELLKLSYLPISVVIIGIGSQDFGKMISFDISNGNLSRGRTVAARPFVQFVPYDDFKGDLSLLAEKVLGNIPDQVTSYYHDVQGGAPVNHAY